MDLYLLQYNNYYNRQVKKFDTLQQYLVSPYYSDQVVENVSFNPNDGINTEQIVNTNYVCDYAILADGNQIVSRWFVIEVSRLRNQQWKLLLRRDLIVDNYLSIINAPCFIEKAIVNNNDPAIFNKENMSFNQIKTSETLLKDRSGCPWIVGYYAKDYVDPTDANKSLIISKEDPATTVRPIDITIDGQIDTWEYYQYVNTNNFIKSSKLSNYYVTWYQNQSVPLESISKINYRTTVEQNNVSYKAGPIANNSPLISNALSKSAIDNQNKAIQNTIKFEDLEALDLSAYTDWVEHSQSEFDNLKNLNGKILSCKTISGATQLYQIEVYQTSLDKVIIPEIGSSVYNLMANGMNQLIANGTFSGSVDKSCFGVTVSANEALHLSIKQYSSTSVYTSINNASNRYNPLNQPYGMFAIPYGQIPITSTALTPQEFKTNPEISLAVAYKLIEKYSGSGTLYDVQLLPYCPMQNIIIEDGIIQINNSDTKLCQYIYDVNQNNPPVGIVLNCNTSSFSFNIEKT